MAGDTIVLKFGSSVLYSQAELPTAVHEIYRWYRAGWRVIAIVSAIGDTTETLLREARSLASEPQPEATAELLATGERHSAALLGIALDRAGIKARVVDPRDIGLTTDGSALDSEPVAVDRSRIERLLQASPVIVIPGFFGYDAAGQLQLLGRGGSDLSAVYLAHAAGASRCRLLKDVDGVYERDPAVISLAPSRRFVTLGYAEAIERAKQLIQPKAVRFLERHSASAQVAGIAQSHESVVGPLERTLTPSRRTAPVSVLILGLGTVGFGVYQRIAAMPEHFRFVGALVRDPQQHVARGVAADRLHTLEDDIAGLQADVVVDALPGFGPSHRLAKLFIARGVSVVSANKVLIAEAGEELTALAAKHATSLRYSAAVGGGTPMLELLKREAHTGEIRSIAGVLNGTCNYVLDRCAEGLPLNEAVRAAQECGFAEADPTEDLSGRDAGRKLRILARQAFGQELSALEIEPLNPATLLRSTTALSDTQALRVVAKAWKLGNKVFGQVQLEAVASDDAFAQTRNEWNMLAVSREDGQTVSVTGRGAGRWPTSEAVIADLLELHGAHAAIEEEERRKYG